MGASATNERGGGARTLPDGVEAAIGAYLDNVERAVPELVDTLHVTGSVALGDYQPSISDVDLVALCSHSPTPEEMTALEQVHRPSRPTVDVLYATRSDLRRDPSGLSLSGSVDGVLHALADPAAAQSISDTAMPSRKTTFSGRGSDGGPPTGRHGCDSSPTPTGSTPALR
jgi:hypothetical protein